MEYSFPFRDILKDIHQINFGYDRLSWIFTWIFIFVSEYSKRIFIINFWNIHLNCSSTWNILFHLEIFSKIFIRSTLVILDIHMNIHFRFWIFLWLSWLFTWIFVFYSEYLYLKKNILAFFFWIFRTPLTRRCRAAALIASLCCPSATPFLDLSLCFQQWLASISRHLCQI